MSFKRKLISAAATGLAAIAFTTFVSAQDTNTNKEDNSIQKQEMRERRGGKRNFGGKGMRGGKHRGGDKMMLRGLGRLNLSDAQKEQVRVLSENFKTSTQSQREELRTLAMKRRDGVISADEQARAKELRTQLRTAGEQMQNSVQAILTAEQKAQLEQMKQEMKSRRDEFKQNRKNRQKQTTSDTEIN